RAAGGLAQLGSSRTRADGTVCGVPIHWGRRASSRACRLGAHIVRLRRPRDHGRPRTWRHRPLGSAQRVRANVERRGDRRDTTRRARFGNAIRSTVTRALSGLSTSGTPATWVTSCTRSHGVRAATGSRGYADLDWARLSIPYRPRRVVSILTHAIHEW